MKTLLVLMALLAVAPIVRAQGNDSQSDSYVCYHGAPDDPRTNAACDRVQAAASQPVTPVAPVAALPKPTPNSAQNTGVLAVTPNPESPAAAPAATPAQTVQTDVGEEPLNAGDNAVEGAASDNEGTDVSVHGSWLAGLGVLAIVALAIASFIGLVVYFVPTIIAIARRKQNALGIFLLNLLLGWSFIGWVAALVWSLMSEA